MQCAQLAVASNSSHKQHMYAGDIRNTAKASTAVTLARDTHMVPGSAPCSRLMTHAYRQTYRAIKCSQPARVQVAFRNTAKASAAVTRARGTHMVAGIAGAAVFSLESL